MAWGGPIGIGVGLGVGRKAASSAPALSLDFTTGSLPAGVTLTRASSGTCFDITGTLVTRATDVARFDYNPTTHASYGIVVEASATNIILQSEDFSNAAWSITAGSITANAVAAPDGNTTADKFTESTGTSDFALYDTTPFASQTTASFSVFAKYAGRFIGLRFFNAANDYVTVIFNLQTGAVTQSTTSGATYSGVSSSITDCGNGWYRCSVTGTRASGTTYYSLDLANSGTPTLNSGGDTTYTGDGTSGAYFWGAQVESGSTLSTYIATTSATATRAADSLGFTIPAGIGHLVYTFYDSTTQTVAVSSGAYTVPTNLNRADIKTIVGTA